MMSFFFPDKVDDDDDEDEDDEDEDDDDDDAGAGGAGGGDDVLGKTHTRISTRSFVRYCGQGSSLLWTPALRPLCRSNAPAQGEEGNW